MRRSNDHTKAALLFVIAALVLGGIIFGAIRFSQGISASPEAASEEVAAKQTSSSAEAGTVKAPDEEGGDEASIETEAPALPTVSRTWLVGSWRSGEGKSPAQVQSCDTYNIIQFNADGTYSDGGSEGRFRTDGQTITYFDRQTIPEIGEDPDQPFEPEPLPDQTYTIRSIGAHGFMEGKDAWFRCDRW